MLRENNQLRALVPNTPLYNEINNLVSSKQIVKKNKQAYNDIIGEQKDWLVPEKKQPEEKPVGETLTTEQKEKIKFYDELNTYFKGSVPKDLKDQWEKLNQRPNITQEEYNNLKQQANKPSVEGLPTTWKEDLAELKDLKDKLDKASKGEIKDPTILNLLTTLLKDENKNLWEHVNNLTKIVEEVVPKAIKPSKQN